MKKTKGISFCFPLLKKLNNINYFFSIWSQYFKKKHFLMNAGIEGTLGLSFKNLVFLIVSLKTLGTLLVISN